MQQQVQTGGRGRAIMTPRQAYALLGSITWVEGSPPLPAPQRTVVSTQVLQQDPNVTIQNSLFSKSRCMELACRVCAPAYLASAFA